MLSIIADNFNWSTGIQSRNCSVDKLSTDMSLLLVARLMDIFRLSIPPSKTFQTHLKKNNMTYTGIV